MYLTIAFHITACDSFHLQRDFLGVLIQQPRAYFKKAKHKQNCVLQIDIVNASYCFFCFFFFFNAENVCHSYCCEILSSLGLVQDPLKSVEKRLLLITKGFASGPVCLEPMAKFFKSGWRHWECQTQLNMILMYSSFIIVFCSWSGEAGGSQVTFPMVYSWMSSCFCSVSHRSVEHAGRIRVWSQAVLHVSSAFLIRVGGFVWKL